VSTRDWDEEFWNLTGMDPNQVNEESEEYSQFAYMQISDIPEYIDYLNVLIEKEKIEIQTKVIFMNSLQSRVFFNAVVGLSVAALTIMAGALTIWRFIN
jgi:nucleoside-specific outer membrane channel protein Tsx